jgi:hypothetical protein
MGKTMNKTLLLSMMLLLSACATNEASAQVAANPCKNLNTPGKPLQLQLDEFELVLKRKKRMCLDFRQIKTDMFRIRVDTGDSNYSWDDGPITVAGKSQATGSPTISGSNSAGDPDIILVTVTDASVQSSVSADYDYWIKVPGVGLLDPKVRIIRQNSTPLRKDDAEAALAEIGMDRDELEMLLREYPDLARPKEAASQP